MPHKVAFWNLERLGVAPDQTRQDAMIDVLATWKADVTLVCELSTKATFPPATNLTYRKQNAHQLCYAAWNNAGAALPLTKVTPQSTPEYKSAKQKGGNSFSQLASRALAFAGLVDDVNLYTIHAPASHMAKKVMAFVGCYLDSHWGSNGLWLVVGDFNVTPEELIAVNTQIDLLSLIRRSKRFTHKSRKTNTVKELDYALANFPCTVKRRPVDTWFDHSDHSPILVEW